MTGPARAATRSSMNAISLLRRSVTVVAPKCRNDMAREGGPLSGKAAQVGALAKVQVEQAGEGEHVGLRCLRGTRGSPGERACRAKRDRSRVGAEPPPYD